MRSLIVIAVLLVALVAGLAVVVPRLLVWEDYRAELTARAEAMTGQRVAIEGRIDLNLLPQPTLSLARTTLSSHPDAVERMRLEVDRLDLQLKPFPLLGGRLDVEAVRLVRPVLQLEPAAIDRPDMPQLVGAVGWLPLRPGGPSRITVLDGRGVFSGLMLGQVSEIDDVNLDLSAGGPSGAVVLDGTFALNREPFRVSARLGRPNEDTSSTLRLTLVAGDEDAREPTTLTFGGVVWWRSEAPRLRGELTFAGEDARSAIGTVGEALGHHVVPMPAWLAAPFRVSGPVELADSRLQLPDFAAGLDGAELTGRLSLILAAQPEIDLALDAPRVALPAVAAALDLRGGLGPFGGLAAVMRGRVDLSVGALDYRGEPIRRLRASLRLIGDGAVGIEDARAILPGQTDVGFTGELAGIGGDPELVGRLTAVTENLRVALAWLDLPPDGIAEGRLRSFSLASRISLAPDAWRFRDVELRVDATRATGSVVVSPKPRPQVAARLALDRLDLDAYWPGQAPADLAARLAQPLAAFDSVIEAQLGRLTLGGVQLLELGFSGRMVNNRLTIKQLSVGDLAEAKVQIAGVVGLTDGSLDLTAELREAQPARLLRRLGFEPAPLLARLKPLSMDGLVTGSLEAAEVDVEVKDGSGVLALAGEVALTGQRHYRLTVEAEHPDYQKLLWELGARPGTAQEPAAPLTVAGRLERDAEGEALIAGTARLGATSFTGRIAWQDEGARPSVEARVSIGEPTAPVLAGLLDLTGLRLEWPSPDGAVMGSWSDRPLALHLLDRFDGELELSSKGGLAGPGFDLTARFEEGRLALDQVSMALWGGRLEGQLSLDGRRPLPYLTAALDLDGADLGELAAWLGVAPVVAGPADLRLEATGAGSSVRALVGSLIGEVEIALHDGAVLEGLPRGLVGPPAPFTGVPQVTSADLDGLAGSLPLERGVVFVPPTDLQVDGIGVEIGGQIDLYLWAADLSLRPDDAGGAVLRVVGPLDRPQVRLDEQPKPNASAPARSDPASVE